MVSCGLLISIALLAQPGGSRPDTRLDAQAERGIAGMQTDGWQHVALELLSSVPEPVTGRATLYEWESQAGPRPRLTLPFAVTDRQVLHFYPFRPPDSPLVGPFLITLQDESGKPIPFHGAEQSFVAAGQSRRALRVTMGDEPMGNFRVGLWGAPSPILRRVMENWSPKLLVEAAARSERMRGNINPGWRADSFQAQPFEIERSRLLPDSYVGYAGLDMLIAFGVDLDRELTESQRRALADWVRAGGSLVFAPGRVDQLHSPFWGELIGLKPLGEVTAGDDEHLRRWITSIRFDPDDPTQQPAVPSPPSNPRQHRPVHFLTAIDPSRPIKTTASYEDNPVVYSVPAGFGRVWLVAFDPEAHGGVRRYLPLWVELMNQAVTSRFDYPSPNYPSPQLLAAAQSWSFDADRNWLTCLGERFGNYPTVETLAVLILCYLVVVGPVNYFTLKRRELRVWFITTVPVLSLVFGGVVLGMGFYTHGWRAAKNQLALAVVTPEGDRAFVEEFLGVYGNTSDVYRVGFPRHLPVRPLGEFVANPSGGYQVPANFRLSWRAERMWLDDWRLSFWQTRGVAAINCIATGGTLTAKWDKEKIAISNQTPLEFHTVKLMLGGASRSVGALRPYQTRALDVPEWSRPESDSAAQQASTTEDLAKILYDVAIGTAPATRAQPPEPSEPSDDSPSPPIDWPEVNHLLDTASRRLGGSDRAWLLGITRQPMHAIESPDTGYELITSVYAWPVTGAPEPRRDPSGP
jgi:hypothetical protein